MRRPAIVSLLLLLLAGCDESATTEPPPPVAAVAAIAPAGTQAANSPPAFTSGTTATVVENITRAYQATATDPDPQHLTYTISGGADAARFTISDGGLVRFAPAPDFDLPADADRDNVYQLQLRVSDGSLDDTIDLQIGVTNSREGIRVRRIASGLLQPLYVLGIPGSASILAVTKRGAIYQIHPQTGSQVLLTILGNLSLDGERGLLGLALMPDYASTKRVVAYATAPDGTIELRVFKLTTQPTRTSYNVALSIPHSNVNRHNGGWLGFGPDGHLYAAVGDGDFAPNPQDPNSRLGKILRLRVNPDPFAGPTPQYFLPAPGNPYFSGGGDPFVFALGMRNPFRASFGPDGRLYIGDVGAGAVEEIDVVRPDQPGLNFGWAYREGTHPFLGTPPQGLVLTDPVAEYLQGEGPELSATVIGGYVYRGKIKSLQGRYIFADYIRGSLWSVPAASLVQGTVLTDAQFESRNLDFAPDVGTIDAIVSFGEDAAGNLFIVDIQGEIFMIEPG